MIYEFAGFVLDERRRELRLGGREVPLQPRVFDVLAYLLAHRDRVVSKEELLEKVWPEVVVSDGSLKRAVSLARSALRTGGAENALRNYARQGYRFCLEGVVDAQDGDGSGLSEALDRARRAVDEARWGDAIDAFAEADGADGLDAADLERWAHALQCAGRAPEGVGPLERAVTAHGAAGDARGQARAALGLALVHYERLEHSVGRGWLRRASSFLPDGGRTEEDGMLAFLEGRYAFADGDMEECLRLAERAREIGAELGSVDLELLGMIYAGLALLALGEVDRSVALHDEAAAMALSALVAPWVGAFVYCGVIWACRNRGDWRRAAEWTESYDRWCTRNSLEAFPGTCRLHRAEVLRFRGELGEAEREIVVACDNLGRFAPWAEGDAQRVLGDLRLAQGDLEAAEAAYHRSHELGWDPQPGLALLMASRGEAEAGLRALGRSLEETSWANMQRRGLLLASMAKVALAAGDADASRAALAELDAHPELTSTPSRMAAALSARSQLRAHEGDVSGAIAAARGAIREWQTVDAPLEIARERLRLAQLFLDEGDPAAAQLEVTTARACLEKHQARPLLAEADRLAALCEPPPDPG